MQVQDDIYLGNGNAIGVLPGQVANPTLQPGVGPMGRVVFLNEIPLTKGGANIAALQHTTAATALALTAGTGVTKTVAPDGSGTVAYKLDVPRCLSFTTSADMHLVSVTVTGYGLYSAKLTQTLTLPASATTVNTTKAFLYVTSVVASATDGTNNVSVGTADIFGLSFAAADAGYILPKWAEAVALDAGTFVAADATSPATATTGDVRGTYAPSSASDGTKRLVIWQHLTALQSGSGSTLVGAIGVAQA